MKYQNSPFVIVRAEFANPQEPPGGNKQIKAAQTKHIPGVTKIHIIIIINVGFLHISLPSASKLLGTSIDVSVSLREHGSFVGGSLHSPFTQTLQSSRP